MSKVVLENVSKSFGDVQAIKDISLEVGEGELVVLLGPSGCGKSTTLRTIAGLEEPGSGKILIGGENVGGAPAKDRGVAMVFQSYALFPHMSAFDNIAFSLEEKGVPEDKVKKRVNETAELLGISDLLDRKPKDMSGGQRQRVALGRAIVRDAKIYLLDEPLANLDAKLRRRMRGEVKDIQRKLGIATLFVTHNQEEALSLADRIMLMKDGEAIQVGPPQELYKHPVNLFVARFVGSPEMNIFDGIGESKGSSFSVNINEETHPEVFSLDSDGLNLDKHESLPIKLGIRPEHCSLSRKKKENSIRGKVKRVLPRGKEALFVVKGKQKEILIIGSHELGYSPGDEVWVKFNDSNVYLFSGETGKIIE